jgi:hypothetical protein
VGPVRQRERRREEGEVNGALGRVGRKWNWAAAEKKKGGRKTWAAGWVGFVFFLFQTNFKPF